MRKSFSIPLVSVCALLAGCQHTYTFGNISLNAPIPQDFKNRVVINNSIDFRLNPSDYIGEVIAPNADGTYAIIAKPILATGSTPKQENFTNGAVYDSQIDQNASANGNYLTTVTANLSVNEKMGVDIVDAVHAYVPPSEYPDSQIFTMAATQSTTPRYWIAELYISTITDSVYTDKSGSTNVTAPAFGAGGKVYQQSSTTTHDFAVAAKLIDIDAYARVHNMPSGGPAPHPATIVNQTVMVGGGPHAPALAVAHTLTFAVLPPIEVRPQQPQ
jgi:hypothetical protein